MQHTHQETRLLPYNAADMFALVMDIESYPNFLPWCQEARIFKRDPGKGELAARVTVGYKIFRERFASLVKYDAQALKVQVTYLSGPLTTLENEWLFTSRGGEECQIDFNVSFSFSSNSLNKLFTMFFDRAIKRMVEAFEGEAKRRYAASRK